VNDNDISGTQTGIVYAAAAALSGNRIHDNATGISASVTDPASVLGLVAGSGTNEIFRNTLGVLLAGGQLAGQHIFENNTGASGTGTLGGSDTSSANLIADNQAGVANFSGTVQSNRIENNGTGVTATSYLRIFGNQIVGNTNAGILVSAGHDVEIAGNTIHALTGDAVRIVNGAYNVELISNIIWVDSGYGIYVANDSQAGFWSDYNTLFAQHTGKIVYWTKDFFDILDWQDDVARFDLHSIGSTVVDPLWAVPHFDVSPDGILITRPVVAGQRLTDPSASAGDPAGSFVGYNGVPNLLLNGSFENGLTGWTATSGGTVTASGPTAWDGSSVFLSAPATQPVVQQTIDLVAAGFSATALDSGALQIAFGGRALLQQQSLSASTSLVFFDQDGHPVGSTAVAPAGSDVGRWLRMFATVNVPLGARSVELILGASGNLTSPVVPHAWLPGWRHFNARFA
jgi:Right handed beta helix region